MPAHFNRYGVSFQYPDNWSLDEEEMEELPEENHSVTVYSPGGAFWSVTVHPRHSDPRKLIAAAVKALREEYEGLEVEEVEETCLNRDLIGYDCNFFCLDLTNTAQIRGLRNQIATYVIFCQAEDREFESLRKVFQAMTFSLLKAME
ncbi:MAG: hypothetical protein IT426_13375 [Pirellulales bacterium]|nr:hypothetical protein [Pirellulales bacterium]